MMIMAFLGSARSEQLKFIERLAQEIAPDYRVKMVNFAGLPVAQRINTIRRCCAEGIPPYAVLAFTGITTEEEIIFLQKRRASFVVMPGSLPRVLMTGSIEIDHSFIFAHIDPQTLDTEAKRRTYQDPETAFSSCLLAEMKRNRGTVNAIC